MGMEVFQQKEPNIPGAHKIGTAIPCTLELRAETLRTLRSCNTVLLLNEVSEKKSRNLKRSFRKFPPKFRPEILSEMFRAFLAGRKVLPPNFTRFFPSEISNFKSNVTKNFTNTLLQAWQP